MGLRWRARGARGTGLGGGGGGGLDAVPRGGDVVGWTFRVSGEGVLGGGGEVGGGGGNVKGVTGRGWWG